MKRLVCLAVALVACQETVIVDHRARQRTLSERIVAPLRKSLSMSEEDRRDLALAVAECVVPTQAPRLRLAVSDDDAIIAAGAAKALAAILERREGTKGLTACQKTETNPIVQAECGARLAPAGPATPTTEHLAPLIASDDLVKKRLGLRKALQSPGTERPDDGGFEDALAHALVHEDPMVQVLASAYVLRRSLKLSPPPPDAAVPAPPPPDF